MKAAIHTRYGPPEVVQIQEVAKPTPSELEVLIKIHATTVNRTDSGLRSAEYFISRFFTGLFRPKQQILGNEFAGEIEAIGANVTQYSVGDRVFGFSEVKMGAHAEYMCLNENETFSTIPEQLGYIEAAPICEGAHYALVDIRAAKVKPGQQVLVNGATGAIGSAAVQLLKYFGANVTAVCDTKNVALVQSLSADKVIDYLQEDFTKGNQVFDFVFDAVGKSSYGKCKPILSKNGIYISTELGKNAENIYLALITPLMGGKKLLFPLPTITKEDVLFLKKLVETGAFKPVIDRQYQLDEIVEAYKFVETGQKTGNVVIRVLA